MDKNSEDRDSDESSEEDQDDDKSEREKDEEALKEAQKMEEIEEKIRSEELDRIEQLTQELSEKGKVIKHSRSEIREYREKMKYLSALLTKELEKARLKPIQIKKPPPKKTTVESMTEQINNMLAQKKIYEKDIMLFKTKFQIEDQYERLDQMDETLLEKEEMIREAIEGKKELEKKIKDANRDIEVLKDESKILNKVSLKEAKLKRKRVRYK